jgi:predicted DNA-binding ribbon-helix-helix protein
MAVTHAAEPDKPGHRLSVTIGDDHYARLTEIARKNRVSIAWVVREAVERLLADDQPLFHFRKPVS